MAVGNGAAPTIAVAAGATYTDSEARFFFFFILGLIMVEPARLFPDTGTPRIHQHIFCWPGLLVVFPISESVALA